MTNKIETELLIVGGGCSGFTAGIQAARLGIKTIIVEETCWLGGMITAAGVSAFDGNKFALGGGIFGELRKKIEDYYGGSDKTYTGWISLTCFEPKIAKNFIHQLAEGEKNLSVFFETKLVSVTKFKNKILGAVFHTKEKKEIEIRADITIEATEFGDVLALAEIPYRLGRDSQSDTNEFSAPDKPDDVLQDITYCAILKKYKTAAEVVLPSKDYNVIQFKNSTAIDSDTNDEQLLNHKLHDWESFISYAALPNEKYLLNWPFRANDYPTAKEIYENFSSRNFHFKKAKELTLNYVHYIQTKLGHSEWGLAADEFPTADNLPMIPYVRESRRVKGIRLMIEDDVVPAKNSFRPRFIKESIAIGDYFLDHHHSDFFKPEDERLIENLPSNAPFQVPFGVLVPEFVDGLIAAEKSISVSHIVNGCTRLQPIVMLIGQAAGAAAALSIKKNIQPRNISIDELQNVLIKNGCQIFPYKDLWNTHPAFEASQFLSLKGIYIEDKEFNFEPEKIVTESDANYWLKKLGSNNINSNELAGKTRSESFIKMFSRTN